MDPGAVTQEVLVTSATGSISPQVSQVSTTLSNEVAITLRTYVTDPGDTKAE